jgi:hypothetical protein
MKRIVLFYAVLLVSCLSLIVVSDCQAIPNASVKSSVIRNENPNPGKEKLILPYAFPSDSMGTTVGIGGMVKGYHQDQLLFGGTAFGSADDAKGIVGGMWDYRLPWTERFYFSALGAYSYFPRQRAYTEVPRRPDGSSPVQAGTNNSDKNNYEEDSGDDNWYELSLEYVLPIGSMKSSGIAEYHLENGILQSGATGGGSWNPLDSGVSVLLLGQSGRYQSYETDNFTYDSNTFPFQFGYLYDNTDFPMNPSKGSSQYLSYSQDFSDSAGGDWSFLEFEASKYFNFGSSNKSRQRVLALNFWTGTSPSWSETTNAAGETVVVDNPPFNEGARLGGFYRMRGYPTNPLQRPFGDLHGG